MTTSLNTETITIKSPATGKVVGTTNYYDAEVAQQAIERARAKQGEWAKTPIAERKKIFLRFHDLVLKHQKEMLDIIQDENGKNRRSAFEEILDTALTARHYAYRTAKLLKPKSAKVALPIATKTQVQHSPVGVVGIIAPWNYPLSLAISDAIPALLAGNTVVLKPDSATPMSALRAAELMAEAGLPKDVFQVIPGSGRKVGQALVNGVDYLMFTGSSETGSQLAAQCGERLIGFSGELGGKNPLIVTADADPEKIVSGVRHACFSNTGQLCISIERMYVHRDVADQFIPAFIKSVEKMRIGAGHDWDTDMGSLISEDHADHVEEMVNDAVAKGATVLTGGKRLPELGPAFFAPTVLKDVPEDAELYRGEVFGPVVYIEVVNSHEEAIRRANDTSYGLNASIFGKPSTAREIASQIEAGTVNINEGYAAGWSSIGAPMGGWKRSGVGRRHADGGLLKYTEARTVAEQRIVPISGPTALDPEKWAGLLTVALKYGRDLMR
ncbi:succinic semialdehyde dehydrogenase [Corynebacterium aquatimens]|uniref:succinate-semialdehyde dehydrogenase (NADP(+)) n=1 Tax=Corynebacterium aquatimens TaxID=1190508 RepID=A0A931DYD5_9CORY|nr:succinic semialdehyde dehydrogenase [Corynebacterium aquatimens]MBG6122627.1 succinate-semialdehyde dehydrogenase/glutarate-semialdehyde dehydrogenase [Corynebacterium aquatimens]WJY64833.1 Putative succinate-semialdehyde dehydrogenase [NADP(+)] 2 [Corynebacterium aquatimens]